MRKINVPLVTADTERANKRLRKSVDICWLEYVTAFVVEDPAWAEVVAAACGDVSTGGGVVGVGCFTTALAGGAWAGCGVDAAGVVCVAVGAGGVLPGFGVDVLLVLLLLAGAELFELEELGLPLFDVRP